MKLTALIVSASLATTLAQPAEAPPARPDATKPTSPVGATAQAQRRKALEELSAALGRKQSAARAAAEAHARQHGLATRLPLPDGSHATLMDVHHGHPLYLKAMNLDAARTMSRSHAQFSRRFNSSLALPGWGCGCGSQTRAPRALHTSLRELA